MNFKYPSDTLHFTAKFSLLSAHLITVIKITLLSVFSLVITACSTLNNKESATKAAMSNNYSSQDFPIIDITASTREDIFKIGDIAEVTVHGFEDFSGTYVVDRSGKTHFIHIGELHLAGKSITEVQNSLRKRYGDCCLQNPSISIKKEAQKLGTVVVDGAVGQPGSFEIDKVIKLSEAVALAGGATLDANREAVILSRVIKNERKIMTVNLGDIQILGAADPLVFPNDVIFVQDNTGRVLFNDFIRTVPIISAIIFGVTR